jgi:acetyl-CoA carboxylase biotin carboxylase subunit
MDTDDFKNGTYDTNFIEKNKDTLHSSEKCTDNFEDMVIIAAYIEYLDQLNIAQTSKQLYPAKNRWKKYTYQKNFERL